ncbi:replication initiator protein A [Methylobacterium iners]|uniref:Plasmid replication initiator protein n=1 Tax=Methylobacterium iners TaxID=418707 RepID=A0ABQ4S5E2_9HYPH|nr:replication initiator protein A [Methylobacterium iners]GJD97699.1 hypothetical protein OCOJLMKI_4932 [Methylobacterium iners]
MSMPGELRRPGALTGLHTLKVFERYPFFALGGRTTPIHYKGRDHGRAFYLNVAGSAGHGLPTLTDTSVLIFATTLLARPLNAGKPLPDVIDLVPVDFLRALGRPLGGGQYAQLDAAIQRLHHATILTDLFPNAGAGTTLLDRIEPPAGRREAYRLYLPQFLLDQVAAKQILAFDPAALSLHGLERRLFGWARAQVGVEGGKPRLISLREVHERAGVELADRERLKTSLRQLKAKLLRIAAADRIPGVRLRLQTDGKRTSLILEPHQAPAFPTDSAASKSDAVPPAWTPSPYHIPDHALADESAPLIDFD